mmetsp:Transcript_22657/g.41558  ORF Transcript_22657/g.41558 Transcript_22657/m.41558 type:complete len:116 (+) Transcript_22657:190-537(+)
MRSLTISRAVQLLNGKNKSMTPMAKRAISSSQLTIHQLPESERSTTKMMQPKEELQFGKTFAPHMLQVHYKKASGGWQAPAIMPFGDLKLNPAAAALHYGERVGIVEFQCFVAIV